MKKEIQYTCDICGKPFTSHKIRRMAVHCKECAEELREKGKDRFN